MPGQQRSAAVFQQLIIGGADGSVGIAGSGQPEECVSGDGEAGELFADQAYIDIIGGVVGDDLAGDQIVLKGDMFVAGPVL